MPSTVIGAILSSFTKGVREASPFIQSLAEIGPGSPLTEFQKSIPGINIDNPARLSANKIIQLVRDAGYSVQRTEALRLIRHIRDQAPQRGYIQSVPNDYYPDPARFETPAYKMTRNYQYKVRVTAIDHNTGETTSLYRTVSTNSVLTKNQVYDLLAGLIEDTPSNYPYEVLDMTAEKALVNPGGVLG